MGNTILKTDSSMTSKLLIKMCFLVVLLQTVSLNGQNKCSSQGKMYIDRLKKIKPDTTEKNILLFDFENCRIYLAEKKNVIEKTKKINILLENKNSYIDNDIDSIIKLIGYPDYIEIENGKYFYYITEKIPIDGLDKGMLINTGILTVLFDERKKVIKISLSMP